MAFLMFHYINYWPHPPAQSRVQTGEKGGDEEPDYRVVYASLEGTVEFGAAWKRTSENRPPFDVSNKRILVRSWLPKTSAICVATSPEMIRPSFVLKEPTKTVPSYAAWEAGCNLMR